MKFLTNEVYKEYLETLKEKMYNGEIVGKKNADGTYTANVPFYDLAEYCKENDVDFNGTLSKIFKKNIGSYSYNELKNIDKDYTYGTDTATIQVDLILKEYLRQEIIKRMDVDSIHRKLVARTIPVDSQDVRITYMKKITDGVVKLLDVKEGANLPKLNPLEFDSEVITLSKVGGELVFTYEVIKASKINLLSAHYEAVAKKYDLTKDKRVIDVLKNGNTVDEAKGAASRGGLITAVINKISVEDILPIKKHFEAYHYRLKYAIMNFNTLRNILGTEQFSTPILYDTAISGKLTKLLGMEILLYEDLADNEIICLDPSRAVEEYVFIPFTTESDRNIENQTNIYTFSEISKPALIDENAGIIIKVDNQFTVNSVAGTEVGDTKITVNATLGNGESYGYKVDKAEIVAPALGNTAKGYTDWDGTSDITPGEGNTHIQIVKINKDKKVVAYGNAEVVVQ